MSVGALLMTLGAVIQNNEGRQVGLKRTGKGQQGHRFEDKSYNKLSVLENRLFSGN